MWAWETQKGNTLCVLNFNQFQTKVWGKLQISIYRLKKKKKVKCYRHFKTVIALFGDF